MRTSKVSAPIPRGLCLSLLALLLLLLPLLPARAQTGDVFWFDIPEVSHNHESTNFDINLLVTALEAPVQVTIDMPATNNGDNFIIAPFQLKEGETKRVPLKAKIFNQNNPKEYDKFAELGKNDWDKWVENLLVWTESQSTGDKQFINRANKGMRVRAVQLDANNKATIIPGIINVYIEIGGSGEVNHEIISLKGPAALGKDFVVPVQQHFKTNNEQNGASPLIPYESFNITATQDNTTVEVYVPYDIWCYTKNGGKKLDKEKTYTLHFDKAGQTSIIVPYKKCDKVENKDYTYQVYDGGGDNKNEFRKSGATVTVKSGGDVVVTVKGDNLQAKMYNNKQAGGVDLTTDQLIPVPLLGADYVAITSPMPQDEKTHLDMEIVYVLAVDDDTKVTVEGKGIKAAKSNGLRCYWDDAETKDKFERTLKKGEQWSVFLTQKGEPVTVHAEGNKKLLVYHFGGKGSEKGDAVLPRIPSDTKECVGVRSVAFSKPIEAPFHISLLAWNGKNGNSAIGHFKLYRYDNGNYKEVTDPDEKKLVEDINKADSWKTLTPNSSPFDTWKSLSITVEKNKLKKDVSYRLDNSKNVFQLGIQNGEKSAVHGYFSDYRKVEVNLKSISYDDKGDPNVITAGDQVGICKGVAVRLDAGLGKKYDYQWTPKDYLVKPDDGKPDGADKIPNPKVVGLPATQKYKLTVSGFCDSKAEAEVQINVGERFYPSLNSKNFMCQPAKNGVAPTAYELTLHGVGDANNLKWVLLKDDGTGKLSKLDGTAATQAGLIDIPQAQVAEGQATQLTLTYDDANAAPNYNPQRYVIQAHLDNGNCFTSTEFPIRVYLDVPRPKIEGGPTSNCTDLKNALKFTYNNPDGANAKPPIEHHWTFYQVFDPQTDKEITRMEGQVDNGTNSAEFTWPTPLARGAGMNTRVQLVVTDKHGVCRAEDTKGGSFNAPVDANFVIFPKEMCSPLKPSLHNSSVGANTQKWELLDQAGNVIQGVEPYTGGDIVVPFRGAAGSTTPEKYKLRLTVTGNDNCTSTKDEDIVVKPVPSVDQLTLGTGGVPDGWCSKKELEVTVQGAKGVYRAEWYAKPDGAAQGTKLKDIPAKGNAPLTDDDLKLVHTAGLENMGNNPLKYELELRFWGQGAAGACSGSKTISVAVQPRPTVILSQDGLDKCPGADGRMEYTVRDLGNTAGLPVVDVKRFWKDGTDPNNLPEVANQNSEYKSEIINKDINKGVTRYVSLSVEWNGCPSNKDQVMVTARSYVSPIRTVQYKAPNGDWVPLNENDEICSPAELKLTGEGAADLEWQVGPQAKPEQHRLAGTAHELTLINTEGTNQPYQVVLIGRSGDGCEVKMPPFKFTLKPNLDATFHLLLKSPCVPTTAEIDGKAPAPQGAREEWLLTPSGKKVDGQDRLEFPQKGDIKITRKLTLGTCVVERSTEVKLDQVVEPKLTILEGTPGCSPATMKFKREAPGFTWMTLKWGDGGVDASTTEEVTHIYSATKKDGSDKYTLELTAGNGGACDAQVKPSTVEVEVFPTPMASTSITRVNACEWPAKYKLDPQLKGQDLSFSWTFTPDKPAGTPVTKNGTGIEEVQLENRDAVDPVTYNVEFRASKKWNNGPTCEMKTPQTLTLPVEAKLEATVVEPKPLAVCAGSEIEFKGASPSQQVTYTWRIDKGPGRTTKGEDPVKLALPGDPKGDRIVEVGWEVRRAGYDKGGCPKMGSTKVTVHPTVRLAMRPAATPTCDWPQNVKLLNTSTPEPGAGVNATYEWTFGDASPKVTTTGTNPAEHTYKDKWQAEYTVGLSGKRLYNTGVTCEAKAINFPLRLKQPVVAMARLLPGSSDQGCSPHSIKVDAQGTTGAVSYSWDFGDGKPSIPGDPQNGSASYTYVNSGDVAKTYNVKLTARSAEGCTSTATLTVTVHPTMRPDFTLTRSGTCPPIEVTLNDQSKNAGNSTWQLYENGAMLQEIKPGQAFILGNQTNANRRFTVRQTSEFPLPGGGKCTPQAPREESIDVPPEVSAAFTFGDGTEAVAGCEPLKVKVIPTARGQQLTYSWDFGGQEARVIQDPGEVTLKNGSDRDDLAVKVNLTVRDVNGCEATAEHVATVWPRVYASIAADQVQGCSPLKTALHAGDPSPAYTYSWNVGGVQSQGEKVDEKEYPHPNLTQTTAHKIPVSLRVFLTAHPQCGADAKPAELTIFPPVVAKFAEVKDGCSPLSVQLENQSRSAGPLSFQWEASSGQVSGLKNPTMEFTNLSLDGQDEKVTITLTAESGDGCKNSYSQDILVHPQPMAAFDMLVDPNPLHGTHCAPLPVKLVDRSEGAGLGLRFEWGDGASSTAQPLGIVEHTYQHVGKQEIIRTVKLTATNGFGCVDEMEQQLTLFPEVRASFAFEDGGEGCTPYTAKPTNRSVGATRYEWTFMPGQQPSPQESPTYLFQHNNPTDQTYTVNLKAFNDYGCFGEYKSPVTVQARPRSLFEITPPIVPFADGVAVVAVDNQTPSLLPTWSYQWNWGDGQESHEMAPTDHRYQHWGPADADYQIPITLRVSNGPCSSEHVEYVTINPPKPIASFIPSRMEGCPPLRVERFANTSLYYSTLEWRFPDGTRSKDIEPAYIFEKPGQYHVTLTVWGDGGSDTRDTVITVHDVPYVDFRFEPSLLRLPEADATALNLTVDGYIYEWDFGDGTTARGESPRHRYEAPGEYAVRLTAESRRGCRASKTIDPAVVVEGGGKITFPNAFKPSPTPTGGEYGPRDGKVGIFHPVVEGSVRSYRLMVFNRWGLQVFESEDIMVGWDGFYQGKQCPPGVYAWRCVGEYYDGEQFDLRGSITLLQ